MSETRGNQQDNINSNSSSMKHEDGGDDNGGGEDGGAITVTQHKYIDLVGQPQQQKDGGAGSAELGPKSPDSATLDVTSAGAASQYDFEPVKIADDSWWWTNNRPGWLNAILLLIWCGCGVLEGYSFSECGFADPRAILGGLLTQPPWTLWRVFISGIGASLVVQGLMDLLLPTYFNATRTTRTAKTKPPLARAIAGGLLTGVGLALASSGPTIAPSQIGVNATSGWAVAVGLVAGGIVFAICDELFLSEYVCEVDAEERPMLAIDEWLGVRYFKLAIPAGVAMFAFACMLEFVIPGTSRFDDQPELTIGVLKWPAIAAGAVIGMNQFFSRCLTNDNEFGGEGLGGTGSVMLVVSVASFGKLAPRYFPADAETGKFKLNPSAWQLVLVWVGTTLGAFMSHTLNVQAGDSPATVSGPPIWMSVVGGCALIVGSMLTMRGCICGSSLVGMSELGFMSVLIMVSTFVGAIPTAHIINETRKA